MKKITLYSIIILFFGVVIGRFSYLGFNEDEADDETMQRKSVETISMLLETEYGSGNYEMTTRESWPTEGYTFNSDLSVCEHGSELSWDDENKRVLMIGNTSDKCYVYFDKIKSTLANKCKNNDLASCFVSNYNLDETLYFHNSSLTNGANDNSYRYSGSSDIVNNFVCFNGDDCTNEKNLYRIVGIFENSKVKLLKYEYVTTDEVGTENYVSSFSKNNYSNYDGTLNDIPRFSWANEVTSTVAMLSNYKVIFTAPSIACEGNPYLENTTLIKNTLNTNYINNLSSSFANKIVQNKFYYYVSVSSFSYFENAKSAYDYENGANKTTDKFYEGKIGIINSNDYMYSFSKEFWTTKSFSLDGVNSWIFREIPEFLNTQAVAMPLDIVGNNTFYIKNGGSIYYGDSCNENASHGSSLSNLALRPSFYVQNIKLLNGEGTKQSPYIIE